MKIFSLVAVLGFAAVSFAMNYTGNVYVAKSRAADVLYLSVGCTAKNDSGVVKSINTKDLPIAYKDEFGWVYEPVRSLVKGDTIAPFCFYRSRPDSTRRSVISSAGVVTYVYDKYYMSTKTFTAEDFKGQENLYIDFESSDLLYRDVAVPTVFFKSNWRSDYVFVNNNPAVRIQKKTDDGWSVAYNELKTPYVRANLKLDSVQKTKYTVRNHCLEDADGSCIIDEVTGATTIVRDTVDSMKVWESVYDTLAADTLYRAFSGTIAFSDVGEYCNSHFVYAEQFNVSDSHVCYNSKLGIDVASYKSDTIYVFENPKKEHSTLVRTKAPNQVYRMHVLPPQIADWFGEVPVLLNEVSGEKSTMRVRRENCGWFTAVFFEESIPTKASFIGKENPALSFAKGMNLDSLFKAMNTVDLYYIVNDQAKTFFYKKNPEIDGICRVELQGIVYDTDALLHPSFSCYSMGGESCQAISGVAAQGVDSAVAMAAIDSCIGVTPGVVESVLGADHKPVLSKMGEKCFIKSSYFNQLFNPTEGVNETSCTTIPFHLNDNGKWEFQSDFYTSPGAPAVGGYYPVEETGNKDIVVGNPVADARTKRLAEGPVFIGPKLREIDPVENVSKMNVLCNGPAWNKGIDCSGYFADGDDLTMPLTKYMGVTEPGTELCVWGWSCPMDAPEGWPLFDGYEKLVGYASMGSSQASYNPRWASLKVGRNQHFCFESHAKFTYKKGQKFGVRGDDDIWIFIGGKLVIDLGGTHLAAPGYADLSLVTDKNGDALVVGKSYDIDIFFCDRRTTMSNMNIYSNFYLDQSETIEKMKPCKVDVKHIFDDDPENPNHPGKLRSIAQALPGQVGVTVQGRVAHVSGMVSGSEAVLMDLQGRVIDRFYASSANVDVAVKNPGRYILKTKSGLVPFTIK